MSGGKWGPDEVKREEMSVVRRPVLLSVLFTCAMGAFGGDRSKRDLSGEWQVRLTNTCASVVLPGTLADARLGTRWTREMFETTNDRPQSGALTREYQHLGGAVCTRVFDLPADASGRSLEFFPRARHVGKRGDVRRTQGRRV